MKDKIIISHRGNLNGPNKEKENHPSYIESALYSGFNVELDVRYINNKFYLGHDGPQFEISKEFLYNDRMWVHCKDIQALFMLRNNPLINSFYHNIDDCVLTSNNLIWTYPGKELTPKSIAVMPELIKEEYDMSIAYGICTDYPFKYKEIA